MRPKKASSSVKPALILYSIIALCLSMGSAAADTPVRDHDIVPADYFTINFATSCVLSPDARHVAYTEMRWDIEENKRNTDLWVLDTGSREITRLTFDPASDSSPQWSPDGTWIYLTTSRKRDKGDKAPYNGKTQVWRIPVGGGDLVPVTRVKDGVSQFELAPDGKTLYFSKSSEHVDEDDWQELRKEFKKLKYGHGVVEYTEIWKLDLDSWRETMLVDEHRVVFHFDVSPDETRIAMLTRPDQTLLTGEGWSTVDIYNTETETVTTLPDRMWREEAPSPFGWIVAPGWSGDSQVLSFRVDFDGYPGEVFFAHFDQEEVLVQKMTRPDEVTVTGAMKWMPGTRNFCFTAEDHARRRVYSVQNIRNGTQGKAVTLTPGDRAVASYSFSNRKGPLAAVMDGLDHPPEIFLIKNPGPRAKFDRLTHLNPQVDTWKIPSVQIVKWTSKDGTPVEGILELPPGYKSEDGPLPLVVAIHGGPTSSSLYRFRFWIYGRTLFAAQGWALLDPNYRGSTGYGDKFLADLIGNKNNLDVMDIQSGVDALIEQGIVDEDRMAVMGWSNGGYLTNCLITRDNRFKAASSGAGVFDTAMQWSIEDTPGHVINYSQGLPWDKADKMRETSPLYNVDNVTTPTVIHVGENDPRVPAEHSRGLYRALRHYLNVPTELIVYPDEGHGLTKYTHRKAKLEWDLKWFNHHVLGKLDEDLE